MQDPRGLDVFWKAHRLNMDLQRRLARFPRGHAPGLRSQLLRSADSIPTNIVEGCAQRSRKQKAHYFDTAIGSSQELEYHMLKVFELRILAAKEHRAFDARIVEVRMMLVGLVKSVRAQDDEDNEPNAGRS
jgi:four helix bundle protein